MQAKVLEIMSLGERVAAQSKGLDKVLAELVLETPQTHLYEEIRA